MGLEGGGRGHEPGDAGHVQKLEGIKKQVLPWSLPGEHSPANIFNEVWQTN